MRKKTPLAQRDKTYAQREHFKRRIAERCGITVNRHTYRDIIEAIQDNRATFVEKQSNRISVWLLEVQGVQVKVVYDKQRKTLVTALTPEMDTNLRDELMEDTE